MWRSWTQSKCVSKQCGARTKRSFSYSSSTAIHSKQNWRHEYFEYMVDVHMDGEKMACLLDSGAGDTYMSFELFKRLFPFREYSHSKEGETVRAANDSTMRICGDVTATLDIGTDKATMKIILLDDLISTSCSGLACSTHTFDRSDPVICGLKCRMGPWSPFANQASQRLQAQQYSALIQSLYFHTRSL